MDCQRVAQESWQGLPGWQPGRRTIIAFTGLETQQEAVMTFSGEEVHPAYGVGRISTGTKCNFHRLSDLPSYAGTPDKDPPCNITFHTIKQKQAADAKECKEVQYRFLKRKMELMMKIWQDDPVNIHRMDKEHP